MIKPINLIFSLFLFFSLGLKSQDSFFSIDIPGTIYTGSWGSSPAQKKVIEDLLTQVQDEGRSQMAKIEVSDFLQGSADTSAFAGSFLGTDHNNKFKKFLVGGNLAVSYKGKGLTPFDLVGGGFDESSVEGLAAGASLMAGININKRSSILLNGMKLKFIDGNFSLDSINLGARWRYSFLNLNSKKKENPLFSWQGYFLHFGVQYSKLALDYSKKLEIVQNINQSGVNAIANFSSLAKVDIDVNTISVPVELSTSFKALYFLNLYGGGGMNFNFGSSEGNANLSNASIQVTEVSGPNTATTTAQARLGSKESPSVIVPHLFIGLQINVLNFKILTQYNLSIGNGSQNIGAGLRLSF